MGENTKIEWAHNTFNPWWGCTKVSPACDHCYAESFSKRTGFKIWGKDAERRFFSDKHWREPLAWNAEAAKTGERQRVFCASMADVMEEREDLIPVRQRLYDLIEATPNLDWLLLTKRPQNFRKMLRLPVARNIWPMTTVESPEFLWRIDALKTVPDTEILGLSIEPLLAPLPTLGEYLDGISWVIVGGESGHGARPMHLDWVREIRDICINQGVAFHFKQWGEYGSTYIRSGYLPVSHQEPKSAYSWGGGEYSPRVGKKAAGRLLDGREWDEFPEVRA